MLLALAAVCVAALAVVYLVAVRTHTGQHLDDDALLGRALNYRVQAATQRLLNSLDATSLAVVGGAIVVVAVARARLRLGVAAGVLIGGATATTEVLKRVLPRPLLTGPDRLAGPSFPSGHAAVAAALALGLVLVVPARWRGLAAVAGTTYAVLVGAATVTAGWHRPSDVVGGFLVTVAWAATLGAALVKAPAGTRTERRAAQRGSRLAVGALVLGAALLAVVGVTLAGTVAALRDRDLRLVPVGAAYLGSVAVILAAGGVLVACFLGALGGLPLEPRLAPPPLAPNLMPSD